VTKVVEPNAGVGGAFGAVWVVELAADLESTTIRKLRREQ
jgi:hypothetical protein